VGLDENKAVVQRLFDAINNGRLDELPQVVAPDVVDHNAVIFMQPEGLSGTNTGDYRGLPAPTGQHFESEAIAILRIADGRVEELRGTADRLGMLTQLGILPDIG
jgi:ketosteroid isomerase-like protein